MKGRPRVRVEPCSFCSKEFKRQEHLDRHVRTHTQEKPFNCRCGKAFSRQDLLHRHHRLAQCITGLSAIEGHIESPHSSHAADGALRGRVPEEPVGPQSLDYTLERTNHLPNIGGDRNSGNVSAPQHEIAQTGQSGFNEVMEGRQPELPSAIENHDLNVYRQSRNHLGDNALTVPSETDNLSHRANEFDFEFFMDEPDSLSNYLMGMFPSAGCTPRDDLTAPSQEPPHLLRTQERAQSWRDLTTSPASQLDTDRLSFLADIAQSTNVRPSTSAAIPETLGPGPLQCSVDQSLHMSANSNISPKKTPALIPESMDVDDELDEILAAPLEAVVDDPNEREFGHQWTMSQVTYDRLKVLYSTHEHRGTNTQNGAFQQLPSRQVLSRYVMNFVRSFHPHLPFLHLGTTRLDNMDPLLLLTLAATGAFYGFEHNRGYAMYGVAKTAIAHRLEERRRRRTDHLKQTFPRYAEIPSPKPASTFYSTGVNRADNNLAHQPQSSLDKHQTEMELLKSFLVIVQTMAWLDEPFMEDAIAMCSQLSELLRDCLKTEKERPNELRETSLLGCNEDPWVSWGRQEECLRTLYSAYFVLNILAISFEIPNPFSGFALDIELPCGEAEFAAQTKVAWLQIKHRRNGIDSSSGQADDSRPIFSDCLRMLLRGECLPKEVSFREYGNYLLVQTLVVHINRERKAMLERDGGYVYPEKCRTLEPDVLRIYARALGKWQAGWDSTIDVSPLDPNAVHGPIAFNATAMLRLAYAQLMIGCGNKTISGLYGTQKQHTGLSDNLRCRDPALLSVGWPGQGSLSSPAVRVFPRAPFVSQAVLHAIYALRIPVRVGIPFVARGRTGHWSVQHALSTFSCAQLLAGWLDAIYEAVRDRKHTASPTELGGLHTSRVMACGLDVLRNDERRLLHMVERLVEETHLADSLGAPNSYPERIRRLSVAALRLWADTCKGIQVFEIVHVVGATLSMVADGIELNEGQM